MENAGPRAIGQMTIAQLEAECERLRKDLAEVTSKFGDSPAPQCAMQNNPEQNLDRPTTRNDEYPTTSGRGVPHQEVWAGGEGHYPWACASLQQVQEGLHSLIGEHVKEIASLRAQLAAATERAEKAEAAVAALEARVRNLRYSLMDIRAAEGLAYTPTIDLGPRTTVQREAEVALEREEALEVGKESR
jgi:uncharacterized coiled-coil protein SlyX